jgi:hypothetical protein
MIDILPTTKVACAGHFSIPRLIVHVKMMEKRQFGRRAKEIKEKGDDNI